MLHKLIYKIFYPTERGRVSIITEYIKRKYAGDVAQALEHLPSRWEALSSNPSATKKQKTKKKERQKIQGSIN
jgi:hypothetical protein